MYTDPYKKPELARAYVPYQCYTKAYPPMEALRKGTLFPELYRPYEYKEEKGCR
ncbi:spore coat associated protein CotJA [Irregularibacter muris]|uniref:Spore coat associated protein CotJA n=1 Tax=Irregularibacter muris TaxID=1796619 RepID=A0AAE3HGN7_9FIRM|nr:spore coat associated protein CotJA [Irregularibacter muris]MCR1898738.1 spore coat associated protein CotJA [Irregularibacter muris]